MKLSREDSSEGFWGANRRGKWSNHLIVEINHGWSTQQGNWMDNPLGACIGFLQYGNLKIAMTDQMSVRKEPWKGA